MHFPEGLENTPLTQIFFEQKTQKAVIVQWKINLLD